MTTDESDLYRTGPFRHVSDMENPLATIRDLLRGLSYIAETIGDPMALTHGNVFVVSGRARIVERGVQRLVELQQIAKQRLDRIISDDIIFQHDAKSYFAL